MARQEQVSSRVSDAVVARRLLPVLAAAALGLVPFTVYSTFLLDIAESVGKEPASVDALRGLGGLAAIVLGSGYAAVTHRLSPGRSAGAALVALAGFSVVGTVAGMPWLITFCLGIGAATAILNPALQTAAAARFESSAARGRAATMVTATTTATAVLAAPLLGGLSLLVGWRGALWLTAATALIVAAALWLRPGAAPAQASVGGFRLTTDAVRDTSIRGALIISGLRTTAFMGALAVVAAVYADKHGLRGAAFTPVWTLSGISFLLGNWFSGKVLATRDSFRLFMGAGISLAVAGVGLVFLAPAIPLMLTGTAALAVGHSMIAAAATTVIARSRAEQRSAAFALNGVVQSAGTFLGAALAGVGFSLSGWAGVAAVLAFATAAGLLWLPRNAPALAH